MRIFIVYLLVLKPTLLLQITTNYFLKVNSGDENFQMEIPLPSGELFQFSYKFLRDDFLNAILIEISEERTFYPTNLQCLNDELRIERVQL